MTKPENHSGPDLRKFFHSVRFRLTLWFVIILAFILALFSAFIYTRQSRNVHGETIEHLLTQSRQLEAYYQNLMRSEFEGSREDGRPLNIPQGNAPLIQQQDVLFLISSNGTILQEIGKIPQGDLEKVLNEWSANPSSSAPIEYTPAGQQKPFIFEVTPFAYEGRWQGILVLGSPVDAAEQLPRLALSLIIGGALILLLAFGGGYWLADRAMHPVQIITRAARQIGETDLSRRLRLNRDDELGELADTFDEMLNRLQAAFERQRRFTADASHELRTPLTIIELEASRALERPRSSEEYEKALQVIQSENEWMGELVNELLTLARMDSGQLILNHEKIDLSDLALEVVDRLAHLAHENGVQLQAGELAEVETIGDRSYLTHMLTNLVENAIKYTRGGDSARVRVDTGRKIRQDQPASFIRVEDNGPGIPPEHIPHLFERFYRIDEARSRDEEGESGPSTGTGLGLAIAQSIAHSMGGEIEVTSQPGQCTEFTVWFPEAS